jgi:hypothetical protein
MTRVLLSRANPEREGATDESGGSPFAAALAESPHTNSATNQHG